MKKKSLILLFSIAIIIILFIGIYSFDLYKTNKEISKLTLENIIIKGNKVDLSSLTLKQKIGQMIMVRGDEKNLDFNKLNVGGIFLDRQKSDGSWSIYCYENEKFPLETSFNSCQSVIKTPAL